MSTIRLADFGELLMTREQGVPIRDAIAAEIRAGNPVVLDFEGTLTPSCMLNVAIGELYGMFPAVTLHTRLTAKNCDENRAHTVEAVVENAKRYYGEKLTAERAGEKIG